MKDTKTCRCGCGTAVSASATWAPGAGHDAMAIHERVARIGNTADFCDWFDALDPALIPNRTAKK